MKFPKFSKVNSHRVYDYKPMYYDAEKEELQERIRKIEAEKESEEASREARIRASFQRSADVKLSAWSYRMGVVKGILMIGVVIYILIFVIINLDTIFLYLK